MNDSNADSAVAGAAAPRHIAAEDKDKLSFKLTSTQEGPLDQSITSCQGKYLIDKPKVEKLPWKISRTIKV